MNDATPLVALPYPLTVVAFGSDRIGSEHRLIWLAIAITKISSVKIGVEMQKRYKDVEVELLVFVKRSRGPCPLCWPLSLIRMIMSMVLSTWSDLIRAWVFLSMCIWLKYFAGL